MDWGCLGTPMGPCSVAQEPSRPRPDPEVARAWSLELQHLLFLPHHPAPPSCPTHMPQLAQAPGGRFLGEQRAVGKLTSRHPGCSWAAPTPPFCPSSSE